MDVRLPRLSGVDVLRTVTHRPAVVFTTAFDEYAVTAFEVGAVDYLVKPFGKRRLLETLDRVRVRLLGEGVFGRTSDDAAVPPPIRGRIFARRGGAIVPVLTDDLVRAEADTGGVRIVTVQADDLGLSTSLSELEERLDPRHFVRVHRSHLVNLSHVSSIRRYDDRRLVLRLSDGSTVVASRRGSRRLRERI